MVFGNSEADLQVSSSSSLDRRIDVDVAVLHAISDGRDGDVVVLKVAAQRSRADTASGSPVEQRVIGIGRNVGNSWLVESGIKDGDRVIIEGTQIVHSGQDVTTVEVTIDETTGEVRNRKQGSLEQPDKRLAAQGVAPEVEVSLQP